MRDFKRDSLEQIKHHLSLAKRWISRLEERIPKEGEDIIDAFLIKQIEGHVLNLTYTVAAYNGAIMVKYDQSPATPPEPSSNQPSQKPSVSPTRR